MIRYALFALCLVSVAAGSNVTRAGPLPAGDAGSTGSLPNASFEQEDDGTPTGWRQHTWSGQAELLYSTVARTGKRSLAIRSESGADAGWYAIVPVAMRSRYRLSGWIRTENVEAGGGRGALLNLHDIQPVATNAVAGTNDWTRVEVVFETGLRDSVQVNCLFGGWGRATGTAWFDDLALELLSTEKWEPRVRLDVADVGEPISKYIYGQFIEHLGRCIYGGIWAEMLEDRKFFDPVGRDGSPWKPLENSVVTMEREAPFVGEHTPVIRPSAADRTASDSPSGVVQGGLGLVAGRRYEGRIWLSGSPSAAPVEVRLVWGDEPRDRDVAKIDTIDREYARTSFRFTAGASTSDGRLEIVSAGTGELRVGTVSLMPRDNVHGMRADTLALLRELDSPIYRWPGGNFVSGYDWRDGIGARDRRPPRKNPAWRGIEHNDFGIDEFMTFCRILGTEPYIIVNSGLGEVDNAVEEIQYANGEPSTPLGALRARNGHEEPYGVKWWGIGNEMYGDWQLGHMPLERYIEKNNRFARAMRAADPSIRLIAVGAVGRWSEGMLTHAAEHMDLISEHFYRQEQRGLAAHVHQIPEAVRQIAEAHRRYRKEIASLEGKDIRIALDEWNYWYGPHVFGELGTRYFLKDALGVAAGLNEMARHSDLYFMANYAQTVNVIGCIKTNATAASFATTGLVLKLYRRHFGALPVEVESSPPLDVMAALTEDRKVLTIAVVNPTRSRMEAPLEVENASLATSGRRWRIAGDNPMAYNEPGRPPSVSIVEDRVEGPFDRLDLAPSSVTLLRIELASGRDSDAR